MNNAPSARSCNEPAKLEMKSKIRHLGFVCTLLSLSGCITQSIDLYRLGFSKFDRLQNTSGRIGMVVMYRGGNAPAIQEGTAVIRAFENALNHELIGKGYAPIPLHSGTFTTAINRFDPPPSFRRLSQEHLKSSFNAATSQNLRYVLVVWLEVKKETPTKSERFGNVTTTTTAAAQGWMGLVNVEAYSPGGEQLTMAPGVIHGWLPTKSDQFIVVPLEELARESMRTCLGALRRADEL